jgi:NIPSNAP
VLIYEIRIYEAAEGRADAMRRRFIDLVATKFFPRHGIELLGAFTAPAEDGRLTYMTRFADEDARKKAWASFAADPEWAAAKSASETDGPLLKNQTISVLSPAIAGLLLS